MRIEALAPISPGHVLESNHLNIFAKYSQKQTCYSKKSHLDISSLEKFFQIGNGLIEGFLWVSLAFTGKQERLHSCLENRLQSERLMMLINRIL